MEQQITYSAEQMLEDIFLYMSQLVDEKDFSKVVSLLTDLGRVLAHSERASFWYWDAKHKQYWTLAAVGSDKITVPEGSGIIDVSIQNKETIVINDPYQDERFNPAVDKQTGFVTKSILCMPVTNAKGKVIGAYQAINKLNADGTLNLNPNSLTVLKECYGEPALAQAEAYDSFQFVRNGYFCADCKDSTKENPVFNRIVSLKSSFKLPK